MNVTIDIKQITTLDLPELQPYRTLRRPLEHIRQGIFVAEGEKVVCRLLSSKCDIVSLLLTKEHFERLNPLLSHPSRSNYSVYLAEKSLIETIVGFNLHQGIMAVAKVPNDLPLEDTIKQLQQPYLLVALDGLVNSENVGVVVRNCAAFGVYAILVGETSSSPYLRRAVRNSMGAVFNLPIIHNSNLVDSLNILRNRFNTKICAAHPHERKLIHETDISGNLCIIFGNEGNGISKQILEVCDEHISIPMSNEIDSINVASASAVFLYEIQKRKHLNRKHINESRQK